MRIILFVLLILSTSFDLPKTKRIDKKWYTVSYCEALETPVWIEYKVLCTEAKFSRKGLDFYLEQGVATSNDHDYLNNEWDKGHMAPAADFSCDSLALIETFSYVNCALQHERLNRGIWRKLEARERQLAQQGEVKVRIDVLVDEKCAKVAAGAAIPNGFKKTICFLGKKEVYYFPNVTPASSDLSFYKIE